MPGFNSMHCLNLWYANDVDWQWKRTVWNEHIKCIIWLIVLKASFLPKRFFHHLLCSHLDWSLIFFICQLPSVFFFILSTPDLLLESYSTFPVLSSCCAPLHAATAGIDQTSVSKMMMIIHTTAAVIVQPLLPICYPSVSPSHPSIPTFPLKCHTAPSAQPHGEQVHIMYPP